MTRQEAERVVTAMAQSLFGFALRRCSCREDAEDLAQEIALRAYRGLMASQDVPAPEKYVWTVAHHALSNYYRARKAVVIGLSADEWERIPASSAEDDDAPLRLRREIAYLSDVQRLVVTAFYFRRLPVREIARRLDVAEGTVKWHLFEARKELKRTMQNTRSSAELQFAPIRFAGTRFCGSTGTRDPHKEFFRSPLCQNICYCVRREPHTVHEIADALGVSPVYVAPEVEQMEAYGLLTAHKDRYLAAFLIDEPATELLALHHRVYRDAAALVAGDLCDRLVADGFTDHPDIHRPFDASFQLWSLVPYALAWSGEDWGGESIAFDEVATLRPDGGCNIITADVVNDGVTLPPEALSLNGWNGPMWNGRNGRILWQLDNEWCGRTWSAAGAYSDQAVRILNLWDDLRAKRLSATDAAWLAERGIVCAETDGLRITVTCLAGERVRLALLEAAGDVMRRHHQALRQLAQPLDDAILSATPTHLHRVCRYFQQQRFHSDGWFIRYCMQALLDSGRIALPPQEQRQSMSILVIDD